MTKSPNHHRARAQRAQHARVEGEEYSDMCATAQEHSVPRVPENELDAEQKALGLFITYLIVLLNKIVQEHMLLHDLVLTKKRAMQAMRMHAKNHPHEDFDVHTYNNHRKTSKSLTTEKNRVGSWTKPCIDALIQWCDAQLNLNEKKRRSASPTQFDDESDYYYILDVENAKEAVRAAFNITGVVNFRRCEKLGNTLR